jgi:hypothetical protein
MYKNRDAILQRARMAINYGCNLSRRQKKKILQPLLDAGDGEAFMLYCTIPRYSTDKNMDHFYLKNLKRACALGFKPALSMLALYYYDEGYTTKAVEMLHQAAELNDFEALRILGLSYELGIDGCPKDPERAAYYKERARAQPKYDVLIGYHYDKEDWEIEQTH